MAPVEAGDLGASASSDVLLPERGFEGLGPAALRRIEASLRRCWSSRAVFFSLDFWRHLSVCVCL